MGGVCSRPKRFCIVLHRLDTSVIYREGAKSQSVSSWSYNSVVCWLFAICHKSFMCIVRKSQVNCFLQILVYTYFECMLRIKSLYFWWFKMSQKAQFLSSPPRGPLLISVSRVWPLLLALFYIPNWDSLWQARLWYLSHCNPFWHAELGNICHWVSLWQAGLGNIWHRDSLWQAGLWNICHWISLW